MKRPVEQGERERALAAANTLRSWLIETPFARLQHSHERLVQLLTSAQPVVGQRDGLQLARDIQVAVAEWLGTFRAFVDQTAHLVSKEYGGKGSPEFRALKSAFSLEYDLNPAYRFCVKLRNYCQHVGSPVQGITFHSREEPDRPGGPLEEMVVRFDPSRLLTSYDQWGADVRRDLEQCTETLDVLSVLASTYLSCERVLAFLLDSERGRLTDAIAVIESFDTDTPDQAVPTFFEFGPDFAQAGGSSQLKLEHVRTDWAQTARRALVQAQVVVMSPHHAV